MLINTVGYFAIKCCWNYKLKFWLVIPVQLWILKIMSVRLECSYIDSMYGLPSAAGIAEWCDAFKVLIHWTLPDLSTLAFLQLVAFPSVSPHPPLLSLCTLCPC